MSSLKYVLLFAGICIEFANSQGFGEISQQKSYVKNSWKQVVHCLVTKELFNDTDIGAFPNAPENPEYCDPDPACNRDWRCCMPMRVDDVVHSFVLWTSASPDPVFLNWRDPSEGRHLTQCSKVVYMVDGWMQNATSSIWMQATRDAYLARYPDYCVIITDWTLGNGLYYFQAISNIRVIGAAMGFSAFNWNVGDRTLAVGWSLGGHVLGEFGRFYQKLSGGKKIAECHGLDPGGPTFDGCPLGVGIDETSCETVQIVHTTGDPPGTHWLMAGITTGLGSSERRGKCDWWVNGGLRQGSCPEPLKDANQCGHKLAPRVYVSWISGACDHALFVGIPCPDCGTAQHPPVPEGSYTVPFLDCSAKADYYVQAANVQPYCVDGTNDDIESVDNSNGDLESEEEFREPPV